MPDPIQRTEADVAAELADVDAALARQAGGDEPSDPPAGDAESERLAERDAGKKGWVPKDKFKGDPARWKPASQYLEDGRRFQKDTERQLEELKGKYADLERTGQAFAKFHEQAMAQKDQELADAIKETKQRARQALRDGDDDLADTLDDRVELLQKERQDLKKPEAKAEPEIRQPDPKGNLLVKEWVEDGNEWFEQDAELRQYALDIGNEMRRGGETAQGRRMLDLVAERVRADFPRRFGKSKPVESRPANQVSGDAGTGAGGGGYSIHDLPAEDLALMKDFIAKGWTTKEKFLKNYFDGGKKVHRTGS